MDEEDISVSEEGEVEEEEEEVEQVISPTIPRNKKTTNKETEKEKKERKSISKRVSSLFIGAQKSTSCHSKNLISVSKELEKNFNVTRDELFAHINGILAWPRKEHVVERSIAFITKLCSSVLKKEKGNEGTIDDNFVLALTDHLLKHCDANNKTVRYRCTELLSKIVPKFEKENLR